MDVVIGKSDFSKKLADAIQAKFIKYDSIVFPDGEIKPKLETEKVIEGKKVLIVSRTCNKPDSFLYWNPLRIFS